jgi:hypothetical protein
MTEAATTQWARMTTQQKEEFERDGFLIVRGVLDEGEVERYTRTVDELEQQFRAETDVEPRETVEICNAIARSSELLPLLDHPRAFGLMLDIMGWNIQMTTSHVFVRTPDEDAPTSFKAIDGHADGPHPSFPSGNLRVVPGSHLHAQARSRPRNRRAARRHPGSHPARRRRLLSSTSARRCRTRRGARASSPSTTPTVTACSSTAIRKVQVLAPSLKRAHFARC